MYELTAYDFDWFSKEVYYFEPGNTIHRKFIPVEVQKLLDNVIEKRLNKK